jgi:hypothetical protein
LSQISVNAASIAAAHALFTRIPVFIGFVGGLIINPPGIAKGTFYAWGFLDKRWIVAGFILGVITIYLPGVFRRLLALAFEPWPSRNKGADAASISAFANRRTSVWSWLNIAACIIVGTALAIVYVGRGVNPAPEGAGSLTKKIDHHELMHLGAIQRLHVGGTPFIGAKTHWGPGLQVTTFAVMQRAGFTLRGFRLSHLVLNMIAFSIFFATMYWTSAPRLMPK